MNILLVDDEASVQLVLSSFLKKAGYGNVITASNGQSALEIITNRQNTHDRVSLVITDITMPIMSGMELIMSVNRLGIKVPILVMSGGFNEKEKEKLKLMGIGEVIEKPMRYKVFIEHVKKALLHAQNDSPALPADLIIGKSDNLTA